MEDIQSVLVSDDDKKIFLEKDIHDALKGLFIGAVTWQAHPELEDHHYLRGLGMTSNFVQARALYEFYGKAPANKFHKDPLQEGNTAWAGDFTIDSWSPVDSHSYTQYMANEKPAQKRMFHLAYGRSKCSGGDDVNEQDRDESRDLKNQVLEFAKDLICLTEKFATCVKPEYVPFVRSALDKALAEAQELANGYGIDNPLV